MRSGRLAAIVGVLAALVAIPVPVSQAAPTTQASRGFSEIAGCISGGDNLLVSIVVDESLSLRSTDPRALRVQGITTAVDSLEQLAASVGDSTNIEVSLSVFARSYETLAGWHTLTPRAAARLRDTAARVLPRRDAGNATDYRQALLGAKQDLDQRQRQLGDPHACKLLLWFTDGALDVDANTDAARQEICQVGGIADAVRRNGISVVALALFAPGAGVSQRQRDELRAVAEGRVGVVRCGTTPIPSDSASGVYLPASDAAGLQRLFAGAGALVAGGTAVDSVSCPGPACRGGAYPLDIDPGIAGARLLIQGTNVFQVELTSPGGDTVRLGGGETRRVENAQLSYLVRDDLATLNLTFDPYAADGGRWVVSPGSRSELSTYWFWGAGLSLHTREVKAGAANEIGLRLVDRNGSPLSLHLYRNPRATLTMGGRDVNLQLDDDGTIGGTLKLGVDDLPATLPVGATMTARSAPSGVLLGPVSLTDRVSIALPPAYPSVAPKELNFGHVAGVGSATVALRLTGSQLGPTRVCLAGSAVTLPGQQARGDLLTGDSRCVGLEAGGTKTMPLTLSPDASADGLATGRALLEMSAADGSEPLELAVPLRLEMERPVDEDTRWALIAGLLFIALLVPSLLLLGSNLLLARFVMTSMSRTATKPVKVTPSGPAPLHSGPLLESEDFRNASFSGRRKGAHLNVVGTGITLKARRIFSLKDPVGVAVGPYGQRLVSSKAPHTSDVEHEAPTSLGEVDAAFVVIHPDGATPEEASGTLIMTVPGHVDRQGIGDRASKLGSAADWSKVLAQVAEAGQAAVPVSTTRVSAGGASGSSAPYREGEPWEREGGRSTDQEPAGSPPPLPWDEDVQKPTPRSEKPRRRRRRHEPPAGSPPPNSGDDPDDDSLPPLPDFLK